MYRTAADTASPFVICDLNFDLRPNRAVRSSAPSDLTALRKPDAIDELAARGVPPGRRQSISALLAVFDDVERQRADPSTAARSPTG
jgi:hypothetical protein